MSSRRVRTGACYVYDPVMWDQIDPPVGVTQRLLSKGDLVRVVRLNGCPPPNCMGHTYIANPDTNEFLGLVHTNSLIPAREWAQLQEETSS